MDDKEKKIEEIKRIIESLSLSEIEKLLIELSKDGE